MENMTAPQEQPEQSQMPSQQGDGNGKMKKMMIAIIVLIVVTVAGAAAYVYVNRDGDADSADTSQEGSDEAVTIEITANGFEPQVMQVDVGTTVMWTNTDTVPHGIQANPYPEGTDLPSLNTETEIGPGESYSYTFGDAGEYGYHDKDDPTDNGEVVVN